MIHPLRTLVYDLLVAPFARLWRKVRGSRPALARRMPRRDGPGWQRERRFRHRGPIEQV